MKEFVSTIMIREICAPPTRRGPWLALSVIGLIWLLGSICCDPLPPSLTKLGFS